MSVVQNIRKHFKTVDAEVGSGFDLPAIPFVPKATTLKADNAQAFSLCMSISNKNSKYKFKVFTFSNGAPKDVLERGKKTEKVVKCKPFDMAEGQFNLVEALLEGEALTHWMEIKHVQTMHVNTRLDRMDEPAKCICKDTYKVCLQELKKHCFPKNLAQLQKAYIRNHVKKPNKLSIKNTTVQLRKVNGMLMHFPVPGSIPMAED
eukprot:10761694-Ditylum_brightwellii.AAC.2